MGFDVEAEAVELGHELWSGRRRRRGGSAGAADPPASGRHSSLDTTWVPSTAPVTWRTLVIRRSPSTHPRWTIRSTAFATSRFVTSGDSRSGVMAAYIARRPKTPREESAWIEHIEPSLPCDMARSMGSTSAPRTSPTITRCGSMRSAERTRSASVNAPTPSVLGSLASSVSWSGCRSSNRSIPISSESSTVMRRSSGSMSLIRQRSIVVFPVPVPPATITFARARTAADKKPASSSLHTLRSTSWLTRWISKSCRRIVTVGRPETAISAWSRSPFGS